MNILDKMNEYASSEVSIPKAVEIPQESPIDATDNSKDFSETGPEHPSSSDMVKDGNIRMQWVEVDTSKWCGCNNACYNGCQNVRV